MKSKADKIADEVWESYVNCYKESAVKYFCLTGVDEIKSCLMDDYCQYMNMIDDFRKVKYSIIKNFLNIIILN